MIIDGILTIVGNILGWVLNIIPNINLDTTDFGIKFQQIVDQAKALDTILPLKEAIIFGGVALGIKLALMLFWAAMRLINLIRGAG